MVTKYRVTRKPVIEVIECERETDKCVYVRQSILYPNMHVGSAGVDRLNKVSDWAIFFDTWKEARSHLIKRGRERVATLNVQLEQATNDLAAAMNLPSEEPK